MAITDPDLLDRGHRAREELSRLLLGHPVVSLVDLGYDPEESTGERQIVLRIHVRQPTTLEMLGLPGEIYGFPVRILAGDYHLE